MQVVDNYRALILQDTPMIDVRAPIEFNKGTIVDAVNLPLMTDQERHLVGICYKEQGQQQAIVLGHQLVSGQSKAERIAGWCEYFNTHPNTHLFCFRGGLRSRTVQQWMAEAGCDIPLIQGGYKAFRHYLIEVTNNLVEQMPLHVVSGKTGCGKTELLDTLGDVLDLEGIANHRGSSFGKTVTSQPSQINFEHGIAKRLLQLQQKSINHLIVEDESRTIGRCALPDNLKLKMKLAPVYLLEDDFDTRVQRILNDYVINMTQQFTQKYGQADGFAHFSAYLQNAFNGIKRRLGSLRLTQLLEVLQQALKQQQSQNDPSGHIAWITVLLNDYYDPIYQYQIGLKQDRIIHRGTKAELLEILKQSLNANIQHK